MKRRERIQYAVVIAVIVGVVIAASRTARRPDGYAFGMPSVKHANSSRSSS